MYEHNCSGLSGIYRKWRNWIRFKYGSWRRFYPLSQIVRGNNRLLVDNNTDVTIEGYPRSGNTFAVAAIERYSTVEVNIAHHTHAICQLRSSVELAIPTICLIRAPAEAVASRVVRENCLSVERALRDYLFFYEELKPLRSRLLVAPFPVVVEDVRWLLRGVMRFSNIPLEVPSEDADVEGELFKVVDMMDRQDRSAQEIDHTTVARPSKKREGIKRRIKKAVRQNTMLEKAERLYREFSPRESD